MSTAMRSQTDARSSNLSCTGLNGLTELGPLPEIGVGAGYWSRLLRDRGAEVLAVDRDRSRAP